MRTRPPPQPSASPRVYSHMPSRAPLLTPPCRWSYLIEIRHDPLHPNPHVNCELIGTRERAQSANARLGHYAAWVVVVVGEASDHVLGSGNESHFRNQLRPSSSKHGTQLFLTMDAVNWIVKLKEKNNLSSSAVGAQNKQTAEADHIWFMWIHGGTTACSRDGQTVGCKRHPWRAFARA